MTDDTDQERGPEPSVEELFASYVTRLEGGEEVDFEAFARAHPALESKLRELRDDWLRVRAILDRLGLSVSAAPTATERRATSAPSRIDVQAGDEHGEDAAAAMLGRLSDKGGRERYRIEGEVAHGAMGLVYRVWDEELRRKRAM